MYIVLYVGPCNMGSHSYIYTDILCLLITTIACGKASPGNFHRWHGQVHLLRLTTKHSTIGQLHTVLAHVRDIFHQFCYTC